MRAWVAGLAIIAAIAATTVPGGTFALLGQGWGVGSTVTMHMQMGSNTLSLIDGSNNWNQVGEGALAAWNNRGNIAFGIIRNSSSGIQMGNGINNVHFSSTKPNGDSFGDAIAVTRYLYTVSTNRINEADVAFDTSRSWNSYRGNVRVAAGGGWLYDVRRVAIHEFGHVLGLGHPDEAGQSRTAIMNSRASDIDSIQTDDNSGLLAIYGSVPGANRPPSVTARCSPCTVASGQSITLSAIASDPDGDSLRYAWSSTAGTFVNSTGNSTMWIAPFNVGTLTATVTVTDSRGATASSSVSIVVTAADRLLSGARLTSNQWIQSPNGTYRLFYQGDGNLVLYDTTTNQPLWWTGTTGTPGQFILQTDGNLVIYDAANTAIWNTATPGNTNAFFAVQSDGNVVLYSAADVPLWHRLM